MDSILQKIGFDSFFDSACAELKIGLDKIARVIAEHKGTYYVKNSAGEFRAKVTGKQMHESIAREDFPAVGDWVVVKNTFGDQATIEQVLPRKTVLGKTAVSRKSTGKVKSQIIATNVDVAFVVESVDRDFNLNRIERYLALAHNREVEPVVVLNKIDLISDEEARNRMKQLNNRFENCQIIATSTINKEGINLIKDFLKCGKTYCFLGSSGVGKSSLINGLTGQEIAMTGEISSSIERGRHITTHREMYFLENGAVLIDNPGMREVGLVNSGKGIDSAFSEITDLSKECQFADCTHTHEPGCAVVASVESSRLNKEKFNNYLQLKKESQHYEMSDYERRSKDKKFGKHVKNSLKKLKELE